MDAREQERVVRRSVGRLDESLHQVEKAYEGLMENSHHGAPVPRSPAWDDLTRAESLTATNPPWSRERIDTLHALIHLRLAAASDNLAGTGTLLGAKGEGVYSPWSVARSVLETAAIAYWLLEPGLSMEVRLARGFTDRLVSLRGGARFGTKAGSAFDFKKRAAEVAELARDLGLPVTGTGLDSCVGEERPSKTALVTSLLGSELSPANYSLFSGWAHGEEWALLDAVRRSEDAPDPSGIGRTLRRPALTFDHYQFIAALAARGFSNAVERGITYFGWVSTVWADPVRHAFVAIGKPPSVFG